MDFKGEPDPLLVEHVHDWIPAVGKVLVPPLDHGVRGRREHCDAFPNGGARESRDRLHPKPGGGAGRRLHRLGRPLPHPFRLTIAPHRRSQDVPVALIDGIIAHGLTGEVVGNGMDAEVMLVQDIQFGLQVGVILHNALRVQVIAPTGDLQAVKAPLASQPCHFFEGQVSPLSGEERDGSGHDGSLSTFCQRLELSALASTAASTFCTCKASANDGEGCSPAPMAVTRSTTWCVNPCS
ncbi:hypothetical protein D9M72_479530 [compost metagenome]